MTICDIFADAIPHINRYLAWKHNGEFWYTGEFRERIIRVRHEMHDMASQEWSRNKGPELEAVRLALIRKVEKAWDAGREPTAFELEPELSLAHPLAAKAAAMKGHRLRWHKSGLWAMRPPIASIES
jgi:hypothetical protein